MMKQRFLVLFRRWFFTVAKVCGPIVVYELFALVRQHSHYPPLGMSDLLMEALLASAHGLAVLAGGAGRMDMVQAAEVYGASERATAMLKKPLEA